jgi:large subunit ribosomal protein L29
MKAAELREMSEEQLTLTLNETQQNLFRLRMQAQTERLDAPSQLRHSRRLIARIRTVLTQRQQVKA